MTKPTAPDLLDLAEAVAAGTLRADEAERQVRTALGSERHATAEAEIRDLRRLVVAAGAVRAHASATRAAFSDPGTELAPAGASVGAIAPRPVRPGAVRRGTSHGGDGRGPRRAWLLVAAALLVGTGVIGASIVGSRLDAPNPAPTIPTTVADGSATPEPSPSSSAVLYRAASWAATGSMGAARAAATATLLPDGRVLVAGGYNGPNGDPLASAELYDPGSGTWTATGGMLAPRGGQTATMLPDGKVLVAGCSNGTDVPSAELYDPSSGSWTATGNMITTRCLGFTATLLSDGRVLVAGGMAGGFRNSSGGPVLAAAELYDPGSGSWTATGSMGTPRYDHTASLLPDGKVLVTGGGDHTGAGCCYLGTAELYDPASGSWTATGNMLAPHGHYTASLLPIGKVLVVNASAELYDPATGSWATTGQPTTLYALVATVLADGRVLVVGLGTAGTAEGSSAELYDPARGSWTAARSEGTPPHRNGFTATLLRDGRVLVAGGFSDPVCGCDSTLASAELYDPGSGTPPVAATSPSASPSPPILGGGPILFSTQILDSQDVNLFKLDPGTGERTLLGALQFADPMDYGGTIQWAADRAHVLLTSHYGASWKLATTPASGPLQTLACCETPHVDRWLLSPRGDFVVGLREASVTHPGMQGSTNQPDAVVVTNAAGRVVRIVPLPRGVDSMVEASGSMAWAPDESAIALVGCRPCNYAAAPGDKPTDITHSHLYVVPLDGSPVRELRDETNAGYWGPSWSPDGGSIVVARLDCPSTEVMPYCFSGRNSVVSIRVADGQQAILAEVPPPTLVSRPSVSPDGRRIAYSVGGGLRGEDPLKGQGGIFVMDAVGGHAIGLVIGTVQPLWSGQPLWSPDGAWLLFRNPSGGDFWIVAADGGEPRRLGTFQSAAW
jgi:hypothetical protein